MGHLTVLADTPDEAHALAARARQALVDSHVRAGGNSSEPPRYR
jgi:hypothetical protein